MMTELIIPILQVVWLDVLLSGDNAVLVALACRSLPDKQRTIGLTFGVSAAIFLRLLAAFFVTIVLGIPGLKILGAAFLVYVAVKMIVSSDESEEGKSHTSLWRVVALIALADLSMSVDNVVAIAAVANGNDLVFAIGLLISMPLMIVGASLISAVIDRFPILVWAGGLLLGWVAGETFATDHLIIQAAPYWYFFSIAGAILVGLVSLALREMKETISFGE